MASFANEEVSAVFAGYPPKIRRRLLELRKLVFATAKATDGVGRVEEALRWGEPAYLTPETKAGTTIRIGWKRSRPDEYAMYFHCQTSLVEEFRGLFADRLRFEGNRAIVFETGDELPKEEISFCIARALTYHLSKKRRKGA